jgi:hypothetical protein
MFKIMKLFFPQTRNLLNRGKYLIFNYNKFFISFKNMEVNKDKGIIAKNIFKIF